jgi:hypothetical protein
MGSSCGCSAAPKPRCCASENDPAQVVGLLTTKTTWRDVLGAWKARWGIRRMDYRVSPGLYRVGAPDSKSPVLVTANYKLTVDTVRRSLAGLSVWLLVLDTKGVNVWCAAGKGTFGTDELAYRIEASGLAKLVEHRTLVVPQLGATGVAAHEVKRRTGFQVRYGPVRATDIPAYLAAGMRATPAMRRVRFGLKDRLVLTPMELVGVRKYALAIVAVLVVLELMSSGTISWRLAADLAPFLGAILAGGLLVPLLLPWLPFRAFSLKGAVVGTALALAAPLALSMGRIEAAGTGLLVVAITSYMAMAFTGASTFTTLAGAKLEVKRGLPLIIVAAAVGLILRTAAAFI